MSHHKFIICNIYKYLTGNILKRHTSSHTHYSTTCNTTTCNVLSCSGRENCNNDDFILEYSFWTSTSTSKSLIIHWNHWSVNDDVLFPLSWISKESYSLQSCCVSRTIKIKRHRRPCAYYANSVATFHLPLEGDLVFKLNPGPATFRIPSIVSSRSESKLIRRQASRNTSNLITIQCHPRLNETQPLHTFNKLFTSCLINARSVCNKTLIIKDLVVDYNIDLLGITETWLGTEGNDVIIGELCPTGYRFAHTPRPLGRGGGVGLLFKSSISEASKSQQHFTLQILHKQWFL